MKGEDIKADPISFYRTTKEEYPVVANVVIDIRLILSRGY